MKKGWTIFFLIVAVLVIILIFSGNSDASGEYDAFAQCLTDSGLIMYGTEWCSHCQAQKKMLGKSFEYIDYIDCDKNRETCLLEVIQGYPTWKMNGESYTGTQELEQLAQISDCELQQDGK